MGRIIFITVLLIVVFPIYLQSQTTLHDLGRLSEKNPNTPSYCTGTAVYQNYLYYSGSGRIYLFKLTDPANPTFIKTISGITGMTRIWISDKYLFSYVGSEIRIYDLTNPEAPVLKSNYATGSDLHKVAVRGNFMFLIYIMDMTLGKNGSLEIVDISTITNPQYKASLKPANSEGRTFCFSNTANRIYVSHYNYNTSKGVIRELDYSNPALYSIIREITIEGAPVEMSIEGNRLFLIKDAGWAGPSKLEAYDIESSSITLLSSSTISTGAAWDMHVYENSVSVSLLEDNGFKDYVWNSSLNTFDSAQSLNIPNSAQLSAYLLANGSSGSSHALNKVSTDNWFYIYYYVLEKSFSSHETETYGYFLRLVEKKIPVQQQPTKVQLTMAVAPTDASADGCSVTPPTGVHEYDKDADVTIDANAATGWIWDKWTGDASGSLKPQSIKMDRDKNIQGNFQPILQLSLSSPAERVICPPDEDEEITVANARIFVDGVDWQLNGLTFNFLEKVDFSFIEAWIECNSTKLRGTIEADAQGKIKTISFSPTVIINEGYTLLVRLFFKFNFPMISKTKRIYYPLSETKKYRVSISASQINCLPVPASARPGVKLPIEALLSGTQEIATFINTSRNPNIGFLKIMDAVNSSKTLTNDIIEVCPCEHSEDVETSNAKPLTIKSRLGKDVTKISPLNSKKYVFSIGELTKVQGFTIDGKGLAANGVLLKEGIGCEVSDNNITNCTQGGITIGEYLNKNSSSENSILRNDIYKNYFGIFVKKGHKNEILYNFIHHNSDDGISLGLRGGFERVEGLSSAISFGQIIEGNSIYSNDENGITTSSSTGTIKKNNIYQNKGFGIYYSEYTYQGTIAYNKIYENLRSGMKVYGDGFRIDYNIIHDNKWAGIDVSNTKNSEITSNTINDHIVKNLGVGLEIFKSNNIKIENNLFFGNCSGVNVTESENIYLDGNDISNSWCLFTGVHVFNSEVQITGNEISSNNGNGIFLTNKSRALVNANNIFGNTAFGLNKSDASVTVSANNNWWGDSKGPGTTGITGNISLTNWLSSPLSLYCSVPEDTIYAEAGKKDSADVFFQNFKYPKDVIDVVVSDERGWITSSTSFSVQSNDTTGASAKIFFNVPDNAKGIINKVKVIANSKSEPTAAAKDSFYISIYQPKLNKIKINPDSSVAAINDTLQFDVTGFDQYENLTTLKPSFQTTIGTITSTGIFTSTISGTAIITVKDSLTGMESHTTIRITQQASQLKNITVSPDSVSLFPDQLLLFTAKGFDQFGFLYPTNIEWSCSRGTINTHGLFRADSTFGSCNIEAKDTLTNLKGVARITIQKTVSVKEEYNIPTVFSLSQNYPNPFNPETKIKYDLPKTSHVVLKVYDILGREIATLVNEYQQAGSYVKTLRATSLSSGVYIYRITAGNYSKVRKMLVLK